MFDQGWKFHKGDVKGAEKASFNDNAWRGLDLPHDWSVEALAILRPFENNKKGSIELEVSSPGLPTSKLTVVIE